ncbi:MAG: hypothetical protein LC798_07095 [Chloroflexi bacterium]|nr:hypothetical protein [Chloroflexota bacterium]
MILVVVAVVAVTQSLVAATVMAGFLVGAASLWFVHRDVLAVDRKVDRVDRRLDSVEGAIHRLEERRSERQ